MTAFLDFDDPEEGAGVGEEDMDCIGPRETNDDEDEEEGAGDDIEEFMNEEFAASVVVEREDGTEAVKGNLFKYTVDHSSCKRFKKTVLFSSGTISSLDES